MSKPRIIKPPRTPKSIRKFKQTEPVEVYCRLRPLEKRSHDSYSCVTVIDQHVLQLTAPQYSHAMKYGGPQKETQYTFQYVFDENTGQKALFDYAALPLVEDILRGKNALLFAYGVTCSGKTHTMTGTPQDPGILPRCLDVIFNSIEELQARKYVFTPDGMNKFDVHLEVNAMEERQRRELLPLTKGYNGSAMPRTPGSHRFQYDSSRINREKEQSKVANIEEDNNYAVFVSYCQIYNNFVYDLLEETSSDPNRFSSKLLKEDADHQMYVNGIIEVEVKSTEEAYEVLLTGQRKRKIAHTDLNSESSRSHSVFNIRLVQAPLDALGEEVLQDKSRVVVSQLSLVDLAGSERAARTGNVGDRVKEAGHINQSLMGLRNCIEALRENQKGEGSQRMVPYRDSRLTHLFKNYFEGEGKVRMVVCVNPKAEDYDETTNVMRFAEMAQEVRVARSDDIALDAGLPRGRRQRFQELQARRGADELIDTQEPVVSAFESLFPSLELTDANDDFTLATLATFLEKRRENKENLLFSFNRKCDVFRDRLIEVEKENDNLHLKVEQIQSDISSKELRYKKMDRELDDLRRKVDMLHRAKTQLELEKRSLQQQVDDRTAECRTERKNAHRIHQGYQAELALKTEQYSREVEKTKRQAQEDARSKIKTERRLDRLKSMLSSKSDSDSSSIGTPATPRPRPAPRTTTMAAPSSSHIYPAKSEPDLSSRGTGGRGTTTASSTYGTRSGASSTTYRSTVHSRAMTTNATPLATRNRTATVSSNTRRARSPPPLKPKPIVNARHRRSKSSHEIWLNHQPSGTVTTDTILQPKLGKKRSVSKLTEKDVRVANKYLLTDQNIDSEGDVATKLVKGDILATPGGGSSVVFNDVENLKRTSPGTRKRRSPALRPEDFDGEWTDVETRCHIAHEGHKRNKFSHL